MFNLFRKKTRIQKMENQYIKLLKEARNLSTQNRKESDSKYVEADGLLKEILKLEEA